LRAVRKLFREVVGDFTNAQPISFTTQNYSPHKVLSTPAPTKQQTSSPVSQLADGLARQAYVADLDKLSPGKADIVSQSELRQEMRLSESVLSSCNTSSTTSPKVDKADLLKNVPVNWQLWPRRVRQTEMRLKGQFVELESYLARF
jgi:hypothetical protein